MSKLRAKQRAGVLLLQDNAPVYTAHVAVVEAVNCCFKLLPHDPYTVDLVSPDFILFPKIESYLRSPHFRNNDEIIGTVEGILEDQNAYFFRDGFVFVCLGLKTHQSLYVIHTKFILYV